MLDISKSEKFFILVFLVFGLFCTGLSYYRKVVPCQEFITVDIDYSHKLIYINKAAPAQLERLPGIGPVLAYDIVLYRDNIGGFKTIEELKNVKGIGNKKFDKIKDLISINE